MVTPNHVERVGVNLLAASQVSSYGFLAACRRTVAL